MLRPLLLVDGYNLIHSDRELAALSETSLEEARRALQELLDGYAIFQKIPLVVVYDGHMVKQNRGETYEEGNLTIIFTAENETADRRIESLTAQLVEKFRLMVVTSDRMEQDLIFHLGGERISSAEFMARIRDDYRLEQKIHRRKKLGTVDFSSSANLLREQLLEWKEERETVSPEETSEPNKAPTHPKTMKPSSKISSKQEKDKTPPKNPEPLGSDQAEKKRGTKPKAKKRKQRPRPTEAWKQKLMEIQWEKESPSTKNPRRNHPKKNQRNKK